MIAYLDTSSLVKLFVREEGTDEVEELVRAASIVATSVIAYTEARGAFARRVREGSLTRGEHARIKEDFDRRWQALLTLEVNGAIAREGGDLAEAHTLRAFDALHLASFRHVAAAMVGEPVRFSSFDDRLTAAAAAGESSSSPRPRIASPTTRRSSASAVGLRSTGVTALESRSRASRSRTAQRNGAR